MESEISLRKSQRKDMPSLDSSDPNERKLARRMRIQARLEAAEKEKAMAEGTYEEPEPEQPLIYQAIETSEDTLRQLYLEGKELVTNIMVASDAKEVAHRETVLEEKNSRLERLREDSAIALEKLNEISNKWETIMELNGPLELFENMKEQKAKCLELIEQKNELIKSFQMELRLADEKFMKGRKAMYEELSLLTRRIDEQVLLMKKAYRIELDHIEDSIDATRTEIINKHQLAWESLYNQREADETTNMDRKFELVESFHEELHKLHVDHDENYRAMRIHLETDIQILEQELEQVKALCLLNSEKLDYNYQVLKKREEENVYIKNHQKRRLNKLQDMVNILKKKIDEKRQSTEEEFKKLTKDVERYYKNILDTENKALRFSQVNDEKFDGIWIMKDEEAKELMDKILSADMVIYEQILGLEWTPPPNRNFSRMEMLSYETAVRVVRDIRKRKAPDFWRTQSTKSVKTDKQGEDVLAGHKRLLSHIFELVADHTGFLMEEKLDELLKPYTLDEKTFVRLDNVFVAIGINTEEDLEAMKAVFLPYTICLLCDRKPSISSVDERSEVVDKFRTRHHSILQIRELEEKVSKLRMQAKGGTDEGHTTMGDSGISDSRKNSMGASLHSKKTSASVSTDQEEEVKKCDITHPLMIEKIFVLRALKDFVSIFRVNRIKRLSEIEEKLLQKRITVSRLLSRDDIYSYWEKYRDLVPPKLENQWNAVYEALTRYLALLKERHELNVKAQALRRQNLDLKRLLSHYKVPGSCSQFKLPVILPVPNEPIELRELASITQKLFV